MVEPEMRQYILVVIRQGVVSAIVKSCRGVGLLSQLRTVEAPKLMSEGIEPILQQFGRPALILVESFNGDVSDIKTLVAKSPLVEDIPLLVVNLSSEVDEQKIRRIVRYVFGERIDIPQKIWCRKDQKEMILIPAGQYLRRRGVSQTYDRSVDDTKSEGYTGAFYIDRYPVTNDEYRFFLEKTGRSLLPHWEKDGFPAGKEDHPVVGVNWNDVLAYAKWAGKYIPSPDEWEKAAFGMDGLNFPWGDEFSVERCNIKESNINDTTPVGYYSPFGDSPFGISDMIGNVWEWVYDWTSSSDVRLLIGGAWDTPANYLLSPFFARVRARPDLRGMNFGFRLAISPEKTLLVEDGDE